MSAQDKLGERLADLIGLLDRRSLWDAAETARAAQAALTSLIAERDGLQGQVQRLIAAGNEDVALMREMGDVVTSAQSRAEAAEAQLKAARDSVERAFKDGVQYATLVKVKNTAEAREEAWQVSRARTALSLDTNKGDAKP